MTGFLDLPGKLRNVIYTEYISQVFEEKAAPRVESCALLRMSPQIRSEALSIAQDIVARLHRQAENDCDGLYEQYQEIWDLGLEKLDAACQKVDKCKKRRDCLAVAHFVLDDLARAY